MEQAPGLYGEFERGGVMREWVGNMGGGGGHL